MNVFYLLQKIAILLPMLLTVVLPGLYNIYAEDERCCCHCRGCLQNKVHFGAPTNPLIDIFLYLTYQRPTKISSYSRGHQYNSDGIFPSIWNAISPFQGSEEIKFTKAEDAGPSALTKTVCKDQGPFSIYFPKKETWGCQIVRGAEQFSKIYFWEMLLPLFSFISAGCMYTLAKRESFKRKWDNMLEYLRFTLSFNPKYATLPEKIVSSKIEEGLETDTEDEAGDGDHEGKVEPCQCELCVAHFAAQILLKQKVEELETQFF